MKHFQTRCHGNASHYTIIDYFPITATHEVNTFLTHIKYKPRSIHQSQGYWKPSWKKRAMINRFVIQPPFEENPCGSIAIPGQSAELKFLKSENRCTLVRMTFVAKWYFFSFLSFIHSFFFFFLARLCSVSNMAHVHLSCFQLLANLNQLPDQKYLGGITLQHSHLVASPPWSLSARPVPALCHRCETKWKLSKLKSDFFHADKCGEKKKIKSNLIWVMK